MASSRGPLATFGALVIVCALPAGLDTPEAVAGEAPLVSVAPPDPSAASTDVRQGEMVHVFDTSAIPGGPYYVNDHTLIQARDGAWHLFGIFHAEPMGDDTEIDFVHAVARERDPARWTASAFTPADEPYRIALRADRALGETHLWAPHVVAAEGRYVMVYQGGGADDYRASVRLAESDDLYRWTRVGDVPLFEDFCAARDPMLVRRDDVWALYYTRCESVARKISGVAFRLSRDLVTWSDPQLALALGTLPETSNSAFTESPFVFERRGLHYLSVSAYPLAWDATLVFRSRAPFAFDQEPVARLRAHAAEWVSTAGREVYLTHAGPGQRGVWISRVEGL